MRQSDELQIATTHDDDGVVVITVQGDIDLGSSPQLRIVLENNCHQAEKPRTLAVDIRDSSFIDSAGLALIVEMRKRLAPQCTLGLVITPGSQPERVLKLGRFASFLPIGYTLSDTVAAGGSDVSP